MNAIRAIRERLGLTQSALAKALGKSQGNVHHYERGQTMPPAVAARLIAVAQSMGHAVTYDEIYAVRVQPEQAGQGLLELSEEPA